jgi:maltose alpha-D-glucosyltransferase / alpha-amylase
LEPSSPSGSADRCGRRTFRVEPWAELWYRWVAAAYLRSYLSHSEAAVFVPTTPGGTAALLEVAMLAKAMYELGYELNNRPEWVSVPLRGLRELLGGAG